MNLGDLTNFVEKPLAAVSNIVNYPELGRAISALLLAQLARCGAGPQPQ